MKYKIDVYIVDDHTMFNEGLTDAVNHSDTVHVSRCFTTLNDCRLAMLERCPDVLLLDISMPDGDGITFCQQIINDYPQVKVIAITIHDEYSMIQRMMDCGAHGYVLKSSSIEELLEAINSVWKDREYVSRQVTDILEKGKAKSVMMTGVEMNIMRLICDEHTNPEIATILNLSIETVNWYRKRLLSKFGVQNTVGLVTKALRERLV